MKAILHISMSLHTTCDASVGGERVAQSGRQQVSRDLHCVVAGALVFVVVVVVVVQGGAGDGDGDALFRCECLHSQAVEISE